MPDPSPPKAGRRTGPDVSRRDVLRGLGVGGAGLALGGGSLLSTGCIADKDRYTPDGRLILTYWEKWTGFEGDAAQALVDAYNASQDEVFVQRTTISDMQNKLMLATSGGNPPDIAGTWNWVVIPYAEKNALTPLDGYMRDFGIQRDDFVPVYWDMCTHRGFLWAMPSTPASLGLHYNRALLREGYEHDPAYFDRHGLDPHAPPPDIARFEKLNELLTVVEVKRGGTTQQVRYTDLTDAEKADPDDSFSLARLGHSPYEPDWYVPMYWLFFGGRVWDGDSRVTPEDPGLIAWLRWIESYPRRFGANNLQRFSSGLGEFGSAQNPFMSGKVAMQLQGVWMYNFINTYAPHLEWDVQAFPSLDPEALPEATLTECDVFVVPNGARHPEQAARFIAFASGQEGQELLNLGQRKFSARQEVSEAFLRDHPNPHIEAFIELSKSPSARAIPTTGIWKQYDEELRQASSSVFQLTKSPEDALADACARAQWKLDRERKRWERVGEARLEEWREDVGVTRKTRRDTRTALLFISPWLFGLLAFTVYPLVASLYYSFTDFDVLSKPVWIGGGNYADMAGDGVFWQSPYNTLFYAAFAIPLGLILSLLVAVLLNQSAKGRSVFRTLFFLPSIVPLVAVAMIWMYVFNGSFGLLNHAIAPLLDAANRLLGTDMQPPNWMVDPMLTKPTLILAGLWQVGGTVVIFLASLQDVPRSLYESAELDGASPAHKLWHITVPMISPVIYFNLIIGIINALQVFVTPFILMPDGGTDRSALMYTVYLYDNAFRYNQMGYASAMAWVMFVIIVGLTWAATKLSKKHIYYAGA